MALKKEGLISKFRNEAYAIIELAKKGKIDRQQEFDQFQKIFDAFKAIPNNSDEANDEDVRDKIMWTSMYLNKPLLDVTKEEFLEYLDSRLLSPPKTFDFYFRLGETAEFPEGYAIGHGKLCSFDNLPDPVKESLRTEYPYRIDEDRAYGGEKLEDYGKRREKEWYLHLQVKSVGHFKAREKAIVAAKRSVNILKLVYDRHGSLFDKVYSPFDYQFLVEGSDWTSGSECQQGRQTPYFYRIDYFDQMISDMNYMVNAKKPKDLEKRILNVIDIFGLIDDSPPLLLILSTLSFASAKIGYSCSSSSAWIVMVFIPSIMPKVSLTENNTGNSMAIPISMIKPAPTARPAITGVVLGLTINVICFHFF